MRRLRRRTTGVLAVVAAGGILMAGTSGTAMAGTGARSAVSFKGTPAVGALFTKIHGQLSRHFCTASVVHSARGDLLVTAAHCVDGQQPPPAGSLVFAPGYHSGLFPHGLWRIGQIFVSKQWTASQDPNDDVAFMVAGPPGSRIEKHTGAETLAISHKLPVTTMVIGYPDAAGRPVRCTGPARAYDPGTLRQLKFYCGGYTNGTSGGPFLTGVSQKTGLGDLVGVIGGYQKGGDTPSISYSSQFLANIRALYKVATAPPAS